MRLILCIINEIEKAMSSSNKTRRGISSQDTQKNLLHFLVFLSSPLRYRGCAFLEMLQGWMGGHGVEPIINGLFSNKACAPFDEMVLKNSFV